MKTFCYIPPICLAEGEISSQVRRLLTAALKVTKTPAPLPRNVQGIAIEIDDRHLEVVKALGKTLGLAPGRVVGGLIYAVYLGAGESMDSNEPVLNLSGLRAGQVSCLQEAAPLLRKGRMVLAECGTGSGKGRIIAHAAAYILSMRDKGLVPPLSPINAAESKTEEVPHFIREHASNAQAVRLARMQAQSSSQPRAVIISAPSVENVAHLTREWGAVRKTVDPQSKYVTALVLGRGQFVSKSQLLLMLDDADAKADTEIDERNDAIKQWLVDGMPAGLTPSTSYLKSMDDRICGLMDDLEFLAGDSDISHRDAALDDDCDPGEQVIYRALRDKAMNADLVFTTHAMLCMDNIRLSYADTSGLLPCPLAVLVDEAHLLESVQASIAANSLSLSRLSLELKSQVWVDLQKVTLANKAAATVVKLGKMLANIPNETQLPVVRIEGVFEDLSILRDWKRAKPVLKLLATHLRSVMKDAAFKKKTTVPAKFMRSFRYVDQSIKAIDGILEGYRGFIGRSAVRGNVAFTVGPPSIGKHLAARWATTPMAMFQSGTLLHIGAKGACSKSIIRDLSLTSDKVSITAPIHPGWLTLTPKLMMPATDQFHRFIPPTGDEINDLSLSFWLHECAKVVNLAATDAVGGMLILMSGYDRLEGMAKALLESHSHLQSRLIVQSRVQRVASSASQFKEMARAGERPIWLATGAAWTGLDLADNLIADDRAADDLLLTDLLIPNVPFGLDQTTTHVARVSKFGFAMEAIATQRRFRQGLGRLVRRDGLQHRRLWILDGRLQHPGALNYMADTRRILMDYVHRHPFSI